MKGAIVGDIVGSVFERASVKHTKFPLFVPGSRFTDDTVMTVATAHALLTGARFDRTYHEFGNRHPNAGYGQAFRFWLRGSAPAPYGSWGNGSAMRVSPVAWFAQTEGECLALAESSAAVTHNSPEGIAGAQAVALAIWMARHGADKETIRQEVGTRFRYDLMRAVEEIRPTYAFDVSCQGSVPEAVIAFLDSDSYESAVRLAISLGGDADTQAAIAGSIAEAAYGSVPEPMWLRASERLSADLLAVCQSWNKRQPLRSPLPAQ